MTDSISQIPPGVDPTTANVGRIYDFLLGGKNNFAVDRQVGERLLVACPQLRDLARENRAVLGRIVEFLACELGVRQFIDLGTGLPSEGHVHQVLDRLGLTEECRVVYVDDNPVVQAHARALITGGSSALILEDLRRPDRVLGHPETRALIDFTAPVGVLMIAVLHFASDQDDPAGLVGEYMAALPGGSALGYTHVTDEAPDEAAALQSAYAAANHGVYPRSPTAVTDLAVKNGLEILPPGIVRVTEWRPPEGAPRPDVQAMFLRGGVARKPQPTG